MSLYKDIYYELEYHNLTKEYYRFQGAKTLSRLNIGGENDSCYIYFSNSLDHHMYFTIKRLKQTIHRDLLDEKGFGISSQNLRNSDINPIIKKFVLSTDKLSDLYSYRLVVSHSLEGLMKENCVLNEEKNNGIPYIKRADRRVYGGGYGVSCEWKELFQYLTFFSAKAKISRKDLLELLQNMKISGRMNRKDNISFLLGNDDRYIYEINPYLMSDFNKYNIINALEAILEKKMVLEASSLATSPKKCIKSVVEEYERGREKTLELLRKRY